MNKTAPSKSFIPGLGMGVCVWKGHVLKSFGVCYGITVFLGGEESYSGPVTFAGQHLCSSFYLLNLEFGLVCVSFSFV